VKLLRLEHGRKDRPCVLNIVSVPVQFGDQSLLPGDVDLAFGDMAPAGAKCSSIVCVSMALPPKERRALPNQFRGRRTPADYLRLTREPTAMMAVQILV
jgi:hypothetical protein